MRYRPKICYKVEDVANIAENFASDLSHFVNGRYLLVSGGVTAPLGFFLYVVRSSQ
jgi:hypothetical protein